MKNSYSIHHEGKQLEKDLLTLYKNIKQDTKELKKRLKNLARRTYKVCEESDDVEYNESVYSYLRKCNDVLYYKIGGHFEGWDNI